MFNYKNIIKILFLTFLLPQNLWAENAHSKHGDDHPQIFHSFTLQTDIGEGRDGNAKTFDLNGWIGTDFDRLWLKSEQKTFKDYEKESEVQALYSRNIADFWDIQIGIRHDFNPQNTNYLTIGLEGLAPYFFETNAQIFISENGNYSARLKQELDLLITQKLITTPYFEANFFANNLPKQEVKRGLAEIEAGILTRYEITRKFAPYFALRYKTKTFSTANLAEKNSERVDNFIVSIGLQLRF